jgi:inner membrane protein
MLLFVAGLFFYGVGRRGLLYVSLASAGHLVLDRIWQLPQVLFWPLYGFAFPVVGRSGIIAQLVAWWHTLWTNPMVFVPEIIGLAIILSFALRLRRRGGFGEFVKSGTVPWS